MRDLDMDLGHICLLSSSLDNVGFNSLEMFDIKLCFIQLRFLSMPMPKKTPLKKKTRKRQTSVSMNLPLSNAYHDSSTWNPKQPLEKWIFGETKPFPM